MKLTPHKGSRRVSENELLTHPLGKSDKHKYRFLRVTREPCNERPDSGRILVENVDSGNRTEHYALLFDVRFR